MNFADRLVGAWYTPHLTLLTAALTPLSVLFRVGVALRRALYRVGVLRAQRLPVPGVWAAGLGCRARGKNARPRTRWARSRCCSLARRCRSGSDAIASLLRQRS